MAGTVFFVETSAADIVGFDAARDKLDLGSVSVHNFIIVDTPDGVGFMNPWSGQTQTLRGVSLGQLTIDNFMPIENNHLRQDVSGALAWEHGVTPRAGIVVARSHEVGQVDRVAFDAATDRVDMRYYGTREQIYLIDGPDGAILGNQGTGQMLILLGTTVASLSIHNFVFHAPQVWEDRLHQQLGFADIPATQVWPRDSVATAGTWDWPTAAGPGAPPSGSVGTTHVIDWLYGSHQVLAFDVATDRLDFGWFKAENFSIEDNPDGVLIRITGNDQSYLLTGVALADLGLHQIQTLDAGARTAWLQALATASGLEPPAGGGHDDHDDHDDPDIPTDPGPTPDPDPDHGDHEPHDPPPADPGTPPADTLPPDWLTYQVRDDWGSGFVADVTLTAGIHGLHDWQLTLDASFTIVNLWNAEIVAYSDGQYVIGAAPWNETLAPGASLTWGFQALPGQHGSAATDWLLTDGHGTQAPPVAGGEAPDAPSDAPMDLDFLVTADWGSGFNADVTLTNTGSVTASGWEVWLTLPNAIQNLWNAEIVARDGDTYHIRQAAWNGEIGANQSVNFGFTANGPVDLAHIDLLWAG